MIYSEKICDLQYLRQSIIIAAIATVPPDIIQHTWVEFNYRLDVCRITNGADIEMY